MADEADGKQKPSNTKALGKGGFRTKVGNGTGLFIGGNAVDGRSHLARRYREHVLDLGAQLGGDPTPAQSMLISRAATLAILAESDEVKVASGERIDQQTYMSRVNVLSGVLSKLGLARKAKEINPRRSLDAHAMAVLEAERGDGDA